MNTLQIIQLCQEKMQVLEEMVPVILHQKRIEEIDGLISSPAIWNNPKGAAVLMKERQKLADLVNRMIKFREQTSFNTEFAQACPGDIETLAQESLALYTEMSDIEFKQMMKDPVDNTPAILSISAGAGGLEAANWVTMLLRMYVRYADANGFKMEILDEKRSEEHSSICTDSVSIQLEGPYAYGFFKGESGVHRLIRNSPFNAGDARQTSFAAVQVAPDIEDTIDIKIDEKDVEIIAQTAGGPGGQNVNKVASAVRLKHIPSGINILVRTERDFHANKRTAYKMLKAKLYDIEMKKKQSEKDKQISAMSDVSFGSQIRTYTLMPYKLVKDHRTDHESNNADGVLDGDLQGFIISYLQTHDKNA